MNKIKVEVEVNRGIEKIWKFWNDPISIKMWAFASDDWECTYAENDLVVGGKFVTTMSAKDKSRSFDFSGTYTEIDEHEKICYVMSDDIDDKEARTCEVTFKDLGGGKVQITEMFDGEMENSEEVQKEGWQSILNNFKRYAEAAT